MRLSIIVFTIGAVICFCRISLAGDAVLGQKEYKLATYSSAKTATLDIELRRISDNAQVAIDHMTFPITTTPNFGLNNPWVVADQYIKVMYDCNYPSWGIKIVTDNRTDLGVKEPKWGIGNDNKWGEPDKDDDGNGIKDDWPEHGMGNNDDIKIYGGLIKTDKTDDKNNPTFRADLAWQISEDYKGFGSKPTVPTKNDVGVKPSNPEDGWKTNWAYISDKKDTGYDSKVIIDYLKEGEDTKAVYAYDVAIFGGGASSFLTWHPYLGSDPVKVEDDAKISDAAIYIVARFCSKDYTDPDNPIDFVLPKGSYETTIYLELVSE